MSKTLRICTVAPCFQYDASKYEQAKLTVEQKGHVFLNSSPVRAGLWEMNGTDEERLNDLLTAFGTPSCDVVWGIRGGYGLLRLLPMLQQKLTSSPLPLLVGFSDYTALQAFLWKLYGYKSLHAPVLVRLPHEPTASHDMLFSWLEERKPKGKYPEFKTVSFGGSSLEGTVIPANLCVLTHLIGTPYMPDLSDSLLFLEEIGEAPYRIDRMLTHLESSGALKGVKGVIVGHLTGCVKPNRADQEPAISVFRERLNTFGIPLFTDFPFGHEAPCWPLVFGGRGILQVKKSCATIEIVW